MGNNFSNKEESPSKSYSTNLPRIHSYYHTFAGGMIDNEEGYSDEFFEQLNEHISKWVLFPKGKPSITSRLNDEEIEYVLNHMVPSESNLTRVELQSSTFDKNNLEIGKEFEFDAPLKSFSRTLSASRGFISKYEKFKDKDLIIFRTPEGIMHFNVTQWERENIDEMESVVLPTRWKVDNITDVSDKIQYVPSEHLGNVKIVDISPVN